ncbi:unnamed protein product [Periconia digitata]|uniref:Uncharacterized protein n=1 Tax=Periconia digitata TaxID=1303443 RepID=A0A9W4URZ4_9PLEO|nr:unnamed protein product [Periconia digitata]
MLWQFLNTVAHYCSGSCGICITSLLLSNVFIFSLMGFVFNAMESSASEKIRHGLWVSLFNQILFFWCISKSGS